MTGASIVADPDEVVLANVAAPEDGRTPLRFMGRVAADQMRGFRLSSDFGLVPLKG